MNLYFKQHISAYLQLTAFPHTAYLTFLNFLTLKNTLCRMEAHCSKGIK